MKLNLNYDISASLQKKPDYRTMQDGSLGELVRHVMSKLRRTDRSNYTIMVGDRIYRYQEIESIFKRADFPAAI